MSLFFTATELTPVVCICKSAIDRLCVKFNKESSTCLKLNNATDLTYQKVCEDPSPAYK